MKYELIDILRGAATVYSVVNRVRGESSQTKLLNAKWAGKYQSSALKRFTGS